MQSDDELRRIAQIYRDNIERNPAGAVASALDVSRATAARRIKEARDRGFLPQTTQGKKKG
jgi:DNA-binding Lrp family transcriptional regulator